MAASFEIAFRIVTIAERKSISDHLDLICLGVTVMSVILVTELGLKQAVLQFSEIHNYMIAKGCHGDSII